MSSNPRVSSGDQKDIKVAAATRTVDGEDASVQLIDLIGLLTWATAQTTVGTSAVQLAPSALASRKSVAVRALAANSGKVYVGPTNAVTTSTGYELSAGDAVTIDLDASANVFAIGSASGQTVAILEAA